MIGAKNTMRIAMTATIWICMMSLVDRVISDAVENLSNSAPEKCCTRSKSPSLRSRDRPAAIRAEM